THVRAAPHPPRGSVPHDRAGLPRLRTQRFAQPQGVRVHVRSHRYRDGSLHGGGGASSLHPLHPRLSTPGRLPHFAGPPPSPPARAKPTIANDPAASNGAVAPMGTSRREFWADRAAHEAALRTNLLSLDTTRTRHVGNDPHVERYDPDLWTDEFAFLTRPGEADIQSDLRHRLGERSVPRPAVSPSFWLAPAPAQGRGEPGGGPRPGPPVPAPLPPGARR